MGRFEDGISILLGVILRKSICRLQDLGYLVMDLISVIVSTIRFSELVFRRSTATSGRYSPMSSMIARHDRIAAVVSSKWLFYIK
uniref:Uncharacterized protein n=1 Tax=Nelumbo nucifera TaxID=4432 RepID=A0A822XXN2_NELNU|nr:TPA_asm: hypothetical protein HUJ06_027862 [Nelumbo nucifera]